MTAITSCATSVTWEETVWQGEPAWASVQNKISAIVSVARARLIYLGKMDGSFNLLNAPVPQVHADKGNPWPNQGGHRFWLGPQSRWAWPPPADWEYSAAQSIRAQGAVLSLEHTHTNPGYPAVIREYAWENNRLRCTATWQDNGRPFFGIHIVAVDTPFIITARLEKTEAAPAGLVAAQMVAPEAPIVLPHPAINVSDHHAVIRAGARTAKLGFMPQPLTIDRLQGWKLSVLPGPASVTTSESPDHGYITQVWVGDSAHAIAELEQLTPYLKGDTSGRCTSTIYLEASPPAP